MPIVSKNNTLHHKPSGVSVFILVLILLLLLLLLVLLSLLSFCFGALGAFDRDFFNNETVDGFVNAPDNSEAKLSEVDSNVDDWVVWRDDEGSGGDDDGDVEEGTTWPESANEDSSFGLLVSDVSEKMNSDLIIIWFNVEKVTHK